ncbi:lipid A deacylase LpxR family protein [Vibrio sp. HN007]|uniref:lipid A deacylase LpxR family protein n=1 Tax=Vibrio iocasae TaxID=3098914 RepID=UPI0035D49986
MLNIKINRYTVTLLPLALLCTSEALATSFALTVDNDGVFGTDKDYTSGVIIDIGSELPKELATGQRWRLQLGQKIWTPSDLKATTPQPNERPYAGLLYAQGSILTQTMGGLHEVGLLIGTTGPNSYAEKGQKFIHSITNSTNPEGWDYQVDNQVVGNALYRGQFLLDNPLQDQELSAQLRVEAGNFRSEVASGMMWRWGTNLSSSFGSVTPNHEGGFSPAMLDGRSGAFLFTGIEGRYRFNDITIEGDTMNEVYPVHLQNWQGTVVAGGVIYNGSIGASLTLASKTKDYKEAESNITSNASISLFARF